MPVGSFGNRLLTYSKADVTQGHFLSNFGKQLSLSNAAWALSLRMDNKFLPGHFKSVMALCLTWLPVDGNIDQSCPAKLLKKLPCEILA